MTNANAQHNIIDALPAVVQASIQEIIEDHGSDHPEKLAERIMDELRALQNVVTNQG